MKNLTMPQVVMIVGLFAVTAWCAMQWPERYYYRGSVDDSNGTLRINKWTGHIQYSRPGPNQDWRP